MNAKQYREQRDRALREKWRVEGLVKDIESVIGSMLDHTVETYRIKQLIGGWRAELVVEHGQNTEERWNG